MGPRGVTLGPEWTLLGLIGCFVDWLAAVWAQLAAGHLVFTKPCRPPIRPIALVVTYQLSASLAYQLHDSGPLLCEQA